MGIKDVWAIRDCTVIFTRSYEDKSPYGNRVYTEDIITGEILLHAHLDWYAVKAGDILIKGDVFAEIGETGFCKNGAHLHAGMFKPGTPLAQLRAKNAIDPMPYFKLYGFPCITKITNLYGSSHFNRIAKTDKGEVSLKWHEGVDFSSWRKRDVA